MVQRSVTLSLSLTALAACCPAPTKATVPVEEAQEVALPPVEETPPVEESRPGPPPAPRPVVLEGLGATVVVPPGVTAARADESSLAADGFAYLSPVARISGVVGVIEVSTGAELGWVPTTLADNVADPAKQTHEKVAATEGPNGNWAAAYKLTESCYVQAWSPAAKLWCEASSPGMVGVPCDQVQPVIDVCLTLAPEGAVEAPRLDVASAFPNLKDPKAIDAVVAAGRAVAANDLAAFTAQLAPGKVKLGKKKVDAKGLTRAVAKAKSLSILLGNDCTPQGERTWTCRWSSEADGASGKLSVHSRDGYGVIPTIDLARQPDGAWRVTGFGSVDLGEP